MGTETLQNTTKTFKFSYPTCTNEDLLFKLEVPVEIPHGGSTRELVQRVIKMFHIPVYLEDELNEKLAKFVSDETKKFHNERDARLLDRLKGGELNADDIVKRWDKLFKENVVEFAEQKGTSEEEEFAATYHSLVHSPALNTVLQVEHSYAKMWRETLSSRDEDMKRLTDRQTEEMETKMRELESGLTTTEEINLVSARHLEERGVAAARWAAQLAAIAAQGRAHHRAWATHRNSLTSLSIESELADAARSEPIPAAASSPATADGATGGRVLEESFTIHLGSQLKHTHNIRLVAADIADLCTITDIDNPAEMSRRLQTSLSLYSGQLSAAVRCHEAGAPLDPAILPAATHTPEHHFPDLETQLQHILEKTKEPLECRNLHRTASNVSGGGGGRRGGRRLQPGDVFVTTHSNLADVHVVFHLVVDDSSMRSGEISSRHPAILGLRNILKAACANDVAAIAIPILLMHELAEESRVGWCVRRAELVLKCAKGFLLEGGAPHTTHFLLPTHTDPSLFAAIAELLPNIFRMSNPLKFKAVSPQ